VEEKYLPVIKKIIKEDSLQLVDYWSVDFDYDLVTFQPGFPSARKTKELSSPVNGWLRSS
jgi:hypothetical protein